MCLHMQRCQLLLNFSILLRKCVCCSENCHRISLKILNFLVISFMYVKKIPIFVLIWVKWMKFWELVTGVSFHRFAVLHMAPCDIMNGQSHDHAPAFYRARWLAKVTWYVQSTWRKKLATVISGRISGKSLCPEFVIHQHFSRCCCSYRKQMRDYSKTCLPTVLICLILQWKTALALKRSCNFSRAKIERINTVARHVLLHGQPTHTLNEFQYNGL